MFSIKCEERIEKGFADAAAAYPEIYGKIIEKFNECSEHETILMKYLYAAMPLSDLGNYTFEDFSDYAKQGMLLWEKGPFAGKVPEDIFLNYVVYHRINEEDISPCRSFFYSQLSKRIEGKSMEEAALEVNYWCAEEATYQTTDDRTVSPMTVYKSAFGRCGEESTFTTSALRSVGIPARQVYAPKWSHCDDNHAWVEVWCDGEWHFIGACEPEEILDKGWFTNASSRAMLIHSRWFDFIGAEEEVIQKDGMVTVLGQLKRYALTEKLTVHVTDRNGRPVPGALVKFEILNYSEFAPIASIVTDEKGQAGFCTGLGSCHLHVIKDGVFAEILVDVDKEKECSVSFDAVLEEDHLTDVKAGCIPPVMDGWQDFDVIAPKDARINTKQPAKEQKERGEVRFAEAAALRQKKAASFYQAAEANEISSSYGSGIDEILKESRGNFKEVVKFLSASEEMDLRKELLFVLTKKDYRDLKSDVLEEHLRESKAYAEHVPHDIFVRYILNPRVHMEPLTKYRESILGYFTEDQKQAFIAEPSRIWDYIEAAVGEKKDREYDSLTTSPVGCLMLKTGSTQSKKILFVAVCRTLGIAARLNPADLAMEYYKEGAFCPILENAKKDCTLSLASGDSTKWVYFQNWTLAVLKNGDYQTLNLAAEVWKDGMTVPLETGVYRIVTSNRLPNGNIFAKTYCFSLDQGEKKELVLSLREAKLSDMLENIEINDFILHRKDRSEIMASEILQNKKNLIIWMEESKEPTEHILNELYERKEEFNSIDGQIIFVVKEEKSLQDPTLSRTLASLKDVQIYYDSFAENVNTLGRRMYVDPDKLPLIIVTNPGLNGVYATSGYNVGTGDMLLRILK